MPRPITLNAKTAVKQRGAVYWFILSVPPALRDRVGHSRWRFSLETTDYPEAIHKAELFLSEVRGQLRDTVDPSSSYMRELMRLSDVSPEEADLIMDTLHPEMDESQTGAFFAARQLAGGAGIPMHQVTLQSLADLYLAARPDQERTVMDAIRAFGPNRTINQLTRRWMSQWIDRRLMEVKATTVRHQLANLRAVLRHAVNQDLLPASVLDVLSGWQLKDSTKEQHKPLPDSLYSLLRDDKPALLPTLRLMRLHALRPSEVAGLQLTQLEGHVVLTTTHSKTRAGRERLIPAHPSIGDIEALLARTKPDDATRLAQYLTNAKKRKAAYAPWKGDKLTNTYGCRVAAITDMARAGIDPEIRQALVGHSRTVHTGYVASYSYDQLFEAVSAIRDPEI